MNLQPRPAEIDSAQHAALGLLTAGEATPHPRLRLHRAFPSSYLPGRRNLIVYIPPGYDEHPRRTYPVLYLQDGQNLFDGRTSFIHGRTWAMREQADAAIEAGEVEPLIIAGIYNAGDRRLAEYTHERDQERGGGEANDYGLVLTREILPWVAGQYRVRTARELYRLIWDRFVASQMTSADMRVSSVDIEARHEPKFFVFRATATEVVFAGWLKIYGVEEEAEKKAEPEKPKVVVDVYRGDKHVQELFR